MSWFKKSGWRHLLGLVALVFALFPIAYIVSASLNPTGTLTGSNSLFSVISTDNYVELFNNPLKPYGAWYMNTIVIGLSSAVLTAMIGALAAYAFSRFRFKGRHQGMFGLLLIQMFPAILSYIAIFLMMLWFQEYFPAIGLGTRKALILIYLGGAMGVNTWMLKGFFDTVPKEIDESAEVDGAGHARTFFTLILPLVAPILAVVSLLAYIGTTNDYLIARTVLGDEPSSQTLAVGLYSFISTQFNEAWGVFAAGAVLGAIPSVALFLYLQKYIVGGLLAGSVKG